MSRAAPPLKQAALDWTRRALAEELRDTSASIAARAENLVAIAGYYGVEIEALIRWIHEPCRGKQWTAAEFRRFCESYADFKRRYARKPDEAPAS